MSSADKKSEHVKAKQKPIQKCHEESKHYSLKQSSHLPLNFDRMFASSLFILFISASLLLPEIKRTYIRIQCLKQLFVNPKLLSTQPCCMNIKTSGGIIATPLPIAALGLDEGKHHRGNFSIALLGNLRS